MYEAVTGAGAATRQSDLVFAFHRLTWATSVGRGGYYAQDRLLQALLREPGIRRMVVADHLRSAPIVLARRLRGSERSMSTSADVTHLTPLRLRRVDPIGVEAVRRTYVRYSRRLAARARRAGLEDPVVLTTNPHLAGFGELDWARRVTYYGTDDFAAGEEARSVQGAYEAAYEGIRRQGHHVAAVTAELLARIAPTGEGIVVPNGIDEQEWTTPGPPPEWFRRLPTPRLLYLGALDRRVDVPAVVELARRHAAGSVVLVGIQQEPERYTPLEPVSNVVVHGPVDRDDVVALVAGADVGLVPHNVTRGTRSMSPLKVYEYLAGGLPVAATELPELRALGDRVVVAGDGIGFPEAVDRALALGRAPERWREEFVRANSWRTRHEQLLGFAGVREPT